MAMAEVPARSIPASDLCALPDWPTHGIQRGLVVADPWGWVKTLAPSEPQNSWDLWI